MNEPFMAHPAGWWLLFTDRDGNRMAFQDVVSEGPDGGYEERLLTRLCIRWAIRKNE